jgi:hypothetical protein
MHSISYAVVTGDLERSEAIAYFQEFLRKPEDETQALLIDQAAACLLDLYPEESMDLIDRAYALGRIDPTFVSRDDFDRQLAQGREDTLGELAAMWLRHNPADFHKRMSWWACFEQQDTTPAAVKSAGSDRKIAQQHKNKKKAKRKMAKASRRKTRKSRKK